MAKIPPVPEHGQRRGGDLIVDGFSWRTKTPAAMLALGFSEKNRYFVFQLMDLYTFNFAYIGSRTTGNDGGTYLIAGPGWKGEVPKNISKAFSAEMGSACLGRLRQVPIRNG